MDTKAKVVIGNNIVIPEKKERNDETKYGHLLEDLYQKVRANVQSGKIVKAKDICTQALNIIEKYKLDKELYKHINILLSDT